MLNNQYHFGFHLLLYVICNIFINTHKASSQSILFNDDVTITIELGGNIYIAGDYEDVSTGATTGNLIVQGSLIITGSIINHGTTEVFNNFDFDGTISLQGSNEQIIGGQSRIYFGNLEINKFSKQVLLKQDIIVEKSLSIIAGSLDVADNNIFFNNIDEMGNVELTNSGQFSNESNNSKVIASGTGGVIIQESLNDKIDNPNIANTGLGLVTAAANPGLTTFQRKHGTNLNVADKSVARYFVFSPENADSIKSVTFQYFNSELNGLTSSELALYVSNDNGTNWIKYDDSVSIKEDVINNSGVVIVDQSIPFSSSADNLIALANTTCNVLPTAQLHQDMDDTAVINGNKVDACIGNSLNLSSSLDYHWIGQSPNTPLVFDSLTIGHEGDYMLRVWNSRGCEKVHSITIDIRDLPEARFDYPISPNGYLELCDTELISFNNTSIPVDGNIIQNDWDFGFIDKIDSPVMSIDLHPTQVFPSADEYQVSLTVTSEYNCVHSRKEEIRIQPLPLPQFTINDLDDLQVNTACEEEIISLKNLTSNYKLLDGSERSIQYEWDFGDGSPIFSEIVAPMGTPTTLKHSWILNGNFKEAFTIRLTASGVVNLGDGTVQVICQDSIEHLITILPKPKANFLMQQGAGDLVEICSGEEVTMNNISTISDNTGLSYSWDFGDGSPATTEINPVHVWDPLDIQSFDIRLIVASNVHACTDTLFRTVLVHPPPLGEFVVEDLDICLNETAEFTNQTTISNGTIDTYLWEFGDGSTATSASETVFHTYDETKRYEVSLTRTSDFGCFNTITRAINVHPPPVAEFFFADVCDGETTEFFNSSTIQSDEISGYLWDFGDGIGSSTDENPTYKYRSEGDYVVILTVFSSFGCADVVKQTVTVNRIPSFDLGAGILDCSDNLIIDPSSDNNAFLPLGSTYEWKSPSGAIISNDPTINVSTSGVYSVTIATPSPASCDNYFKIPVYHFSPVDLGADLKACGSVILDAEAQDNNLNQSGTSTSYKWYKNQVEVGNGRHFVVEESGTYKVDVTRTLDITGISCMSTDDIVVSIDPNPSFDLGPPREICKGSSVLLKAGVITDTYTWTYINSGMVVGTSSDITVSQEGSYQLEVTDGVCSDSDIIEVIERSNPTAEFITDLNVCINQPQIFHNISFTTEGTLTDYLWDFGDGSLGSTLRSPYHTYDSPGNYDVELITTTSFGCTHTTNQTVSVSGFPVADFIINGCEDSPSIIQNLSILPTPDKATYIWDFGDGTTSFDQTPTKNFSKAGSYQVTLAVTQNDCTDRLVKDVTVDPRPLIPFSSVLTTCGPGISLDAENPGSTYRWYDSETGKTLATTQTFNATTNGDLSLEITTVEGCVSSEVVTIVLNSAVDVDLGPDRSVCGPVTLSAGIFPNASYGWSTGENTSSIEVSGTGLYSVEVIDNNGCSDSDDVFITVNQLPVVKLGDDIEICDGESVVLNAGGETTGTYLWSNGATTQTIEVEQNNTYGVRITNPEGCQTTDSLKVTVHETPSVSFNNPNSCGGESIQFINDTTFPGHLTYLWDFGDGTFSGLENPKKAYAFNGTYNVSLTAISDNGCRVETQNEITIFSQPQVNFIAIDGCTNESILFENISVLPDGDTYSYQWDFGDGHLSAGFSPEHVFLVAGDYTVNLKVTSGNGCSDIVAKNITIADRPFLDLGGTITTCNDEIILDALNVGSNYQWNDNSRERTLVVTNSGDYSISITSPEGCVYFEEVTVAFNAPPKPDLGPDLVVCGHVILDAGVEAASYLWSTGERTKQVLIKESGRYSVQTISQDLCYEQDEIDVSINPIPEVDLGPDIEICSDQAIELKAFSDLAVRYQWSNGETSPSLTVTESGTYSVTLFSNQDCTFTDQIDVSFLEIPTLNLPDNTIGCGSLILDAGLGDTYLWSDGSADRFLEITKSGNYSVSVQNNNGCSISDDVNVTIFPGVEIELGEDIEICFGSSTKLNTSNPGADHIWSDGSTSNNLEVTTTGTYSVKVIDNNGCVGTDQISVAVRPELDLELGDDRLVCSEINFELEPDIDAISYQWFSDNGLVSTMRNFRPADGGKYWLTVFDEFGCSKTDTVRIIPTNQTIESSFLVASEIFAGQEIQFAQLSEPDPDTFFWEFGDGGFSVAENPNYTYFLEGIYDVSLTVSNGTCEDTMTKTITVQDASSGRLTQKLVVDLPRFTEIIEANLYPNPVRDQVNLKIMLNREEEIIVQLFDMRGYTINEIEGKLEEDIVTFDLFSVPSGMYMVLITTPGETKTIRFVKN